MRLKLLSAVGMLLACAMLAPAYAGSGGGGGHGGGHGGGGHHGGGSSGGGSGVGIGYGGTAYGGTAYGGNSKSNAYSNSGASAVINFPNQTGGANYLFGAAAIISAFNPPEGQKIIVKGGDVKVQVNFINGAQAGLPPLKNTNAPNGRARMTCSRGEQWYDDPNDADNSGCIPKTQH